MVLSDGYSHCEMVLGKVRSYILVSKDYVHSHYSVLRVLGSLEKQVDIDVLDPVKFGFAGLYCLLILFILRDLLLCDWLCGLRVRFLAGGCFGIWFGRRLCSLLGRSWFLVIFLLVFFLTRLVTNSRKLSLLPQLLQLNLKVGGIEILGDLLETIRDVCSSVSRH